MNPNAHVTDGYATVVVVTDEGTTVSGVVAEETADLLTLKLADGRVEKIPTATIEERASGPSSMPADLAGKLSRRELRDLQAWLQGLR